MMRPGADWLCPGWPIPGIRAYCSTRAGSFNLPPYDGFNTANHVGDDCVQVAKTRAWLSDYFNWHTKPQWLTQVHGVSVIEAQNDGVERQADGAFSAIPGQVCTLHTADCLPVFFAADDGSEVALAHAGWRGLAAGVLQNTLRAMSSMPSQVHVWLGPAISAKHFEVGREVFDAFAGSVAHSENFFSPNSRGRWQCDLYGLARLILNHAGVKSISGGGLCTYADNNLFSFRRDQITGRLLSLIWIDPAQ